jgi:hypothetical protein
VSSIEVSKKLTQSDNIPAKVNRAIKNCLFAESKLLALEVNERSITHKVAEYLQKEFSNYDVDCEYNKDGHDQKKILSRLDKCTKGPTINDEDGRTVYPDIIIHKRDSSTNLVVIEAKKSTNSDGGCDRQKLEAFKNELHYQFCYQLIVYVGASRTKDYDLNPV